METKDALKIGGGLALVATSIGFMWKSAKFEREVDGIFFAIDHLKGLIEDLKSTNLDDPNTKESIEAWMKTIEQSKEELTEIRQKHPVLWKIYGYEKKYIKI